MLFFRLLEISVIHPAKCKVPSIREICICMLVYAYENEVLKKNSTNIPNITNIIIIIAGIEQNSRVSVRVKSFNKSCELLGSYYVYFIAVLLQVNI